MEYQDLPEMGENVVDDPEAAADLVKKINEIHLAAIRDGLKEQEIENFVKYNKFHYEQKRHVKTNLFLKENMVYDKENDQYICYEHKK